MCLCIKCASKRFGDVRMNLTEKIRECIILKRGIYKRPLYNMH